MCSCANKQPNTVTKVLKDIGMFVLWFHGCVAIGLGVGHILGFYVLTIIGLFS